MAERKEYNKKLVKMGKFIELKRKELGKGYQSRGKFIEMRSIEIFGGESWMSVRHLANIERGKNCLSIEMLNKLAIALEIDPMELFEKFLETDEK